MRTVEQDGSRGLPEVLAELTPTARVSYSLSSFIDIVYAHNAMYTASCHFKANCRRCQLRSPDHQRRRQTDKTRDRNGQTQENADSLRTDQMRVSQPIFGVRSFCSFPIPHYRCWRLLQLSPQLGLVSSVVYIQCPIICRSNYFATLQVTPLLVFQANVLGRKLVLEPGLRLTHSCVLFCGCDQLRAMNLLFGQ
ncbi:hypothetical protein BaRGS_00024470 [Batillaria attramentaria]|uniref:Uncharacterized protein n=1 Tax=Batillaria attramentaria TaxID=370345 RepID=A0ABD0KB41_9CAEN